MNDEKIYLCDDCKEQHLKQCYDCEEYFIDHDNDYIVDRCGDIYCENCRDELSYCEYCEEYSNDEFYHINNLDEYWCESCANSHAYQCDDCHDWISENHGDGVITLYQACMTTKS